MKSTIYRLQYFLLPYSLLFVFALIIKILYTKEEIYFFVNGLHFPAGDIFFKYMTELGSSITALSIMLILLFVSYRAFLVMVSSQIITFAINNVVKNAVGAPRPKLYFTDSPHTIYYVPDVEVLSNHFSFPSGHTVCAFTMAVVLTYISPRRIYGLFYFLLAVLVAYSRMYLSQHFFEDVTAGSFEAVVVVTLWLAWFNDRKFLQYPGWEGALSRKSD
jgi:membrane-associated phospholipid phosphatase